MIKRCKYRKSPSFLNVTIIYFKEQYIFIHDALLEAVSCGNTEVHARNLMQHIKRLTEPSEGGTAGLAEEFRKLSNPNQARRLKQGTGSLTYNRSKNRLANILPCKRLAQAGKVIFILHR